MRGLLQLEEGDLSNPLWWKRLKVVLRLVEKQLIYSFRDLLYRDSVVALQMSTDEGTISALAKSVDDHVSAIKYSLLPYLCDRSPTEKETKLTQNEVSRMKDAWARAFGGHPDDPEMRKKIERDAKILNEQAIKDRLQAETSASDE